MSVLNSDEILEKEEMLRIINNLKDKPLSEELQQLLVQLEEILKNNIMELDECDNSYIRFCDYSSDSLHGMDIIDYFRNEYTGSNKDNSLKLFILYSIIKNASAILDFCDSCIHSEEEYHEVDDCFTDTIQDISTLIEEYQIRKSAEIDIREELDSDDLSFLSNNRFRILFAGKYISDDVKEIPHYVKKALIIKLQNELSKEIVIPSSFLLKRIKDKYNVSLYRIHIADDYRLVYMRQQGTTIVLGIAKKSGNDLDYDRYESIAKDMEEIEEELTKFLSSDEKGHSTNHQVVEQLEEFIHNNRKKSTQIN